MVLKKTDCSSALNTAEKSQGLFSNRIRMLAFPVILISYKENAGGRDSSVGIATVYGLEGPGILSRCGGRFCAHIKTGPGAQPASCTIGTGSYPRVKQPSRGADHPHLLAQRSRKSRAITLLSFWAFGACYRAKFCTKKML
jgi:hypothetical protein